MSASPSGEMDDPPGVLFRSVWRIGKFSAPGRDGSRAEPRVAMRRGFGSSARGARDEGTSPHVHHDPQTSDPWIHRSPARDAPKFKTRPFRCRGDLCRSRGSGGRKIGAEPRGILAGDGEGLQGSKAPSIGITCPAFTPCDSNVDRGAHPGSRMRGARSGRRVKRHVASLSPSDLRKGWVGFGRDGDSPAARAMSGARVAARVATADIVRMRCC